MYEGSCLCGSVKYVIRGDLRAAAFCHCSRCRKASGSVFAANATVDEAALELMSGKGMLKSFSTPEGVHRLFCSTCGSPIFSKRDSMPGVLRLRLGTLDSPLVSARPSAHIFVASKADWYEICDSLPQFAERPAG
ncbi:GFA family protein [Thauera sp. Sel9]|uniref:GFA family protein n=1 Tax=Thauera sp. Sel9 TaxID=2974299 RepID=UPI0021E17D2F|nr:GFA family protein [Thauera sp. Sel9]MCV2219352.1 GFA family protein [Thauera sp. Sel9]